MPDATGALLYVEGAGNYVYSLRNANGMTWNFSTTTWEVSSAAPDAAHLKAMKPESFGNAAWSQDVVPPMFPSPTPIMAMLWTADAAGAPQAFVGLAGMERSPGGRIIFEGGR